MDTTPKKKKLLYLMMGLQSGAGMERVLTLKANYLARHGYEVHISTIDGKGEPPFFPLEPDIVLHQFDIDFNSLYKRSLPVRLLLHSIRLRRYKRSIVRLLRTVQPDITIALTRRETYFITELKDGSLKVAENHFEKNNYYMNFRIPSFIPSFVHRLLCQRVIRKLIRLDRFVTLTREERATWTELTNMSVIPNPVSFLPEESARLENKTVIAVGRYVEVKRFDRLIQAWQTVSQKHPDWQLNIYGEGWLREILQAEIDTLGLSATCFLCPPTPNIMQHYLESSIFALTSENESFGQVLVEAMACGVPPVSFACPYGPRDIITNGEDGWLVEPGDVNELALKINSLIEDEALRKQMGSRAKLTAQKYRIAVVGKQWDELFDSLSKDI
jgi:glycosyltransferase involved in cell wall biosynthesis